MASSLKGTALRRIKLVVLAPLLMLIVLGVALTEGIGSFCHEFWCEFKGTLKDIGRIWRGEI